MRLLVILLCLIAFSAQAKIGDVIEQTGNTDIERKTGEKFEKIQKNFDVESYDTIKTSNGRTAIQFVDETRVDVTENSKLVIDEFVYDPNTSTGTLALKASFGTVRYASGQIAKNSKQNVKISTPTAVVGVRGTDFSMTVDETGNSTIVLLPSCTEVPGLGGKTDRICVVGEIEVSSDVGSVILNQAFQATVVNTAKNPPLKPLLLDLDETMINNLLIISKPKLQNAIDERDRAKNIANILDLDFLEFRELNKDYLALDEKETWGSALDYNPLDVDFLFDALDASMENIIRAMEQDTLTASKKRGDITGTDPTTGITIIKEDPNWLYIREDASGNYVRMELNQNYTYRLDHNQNGNEVIGFEINPEGRSINNEITIKQSN
jgi:hypothetical protein